MNYSFDRQISSFTKATTRDYLFLFIIWPFLACVTALVNFENKEARRIVYLFLIYYGLTLVIGNTLIDASRIAEMLKVNSSLPFSDIFRVVGGIYATDTSVDIVEPFISFLVSRFTDDHRLLFGSFAVLFGYFYIRSIGLLYDECKDTLSWNNIIHLFFFASILPITSINGFRMWTAAWIFFLGTYHVVLFRNPWYFILTFAACLVHFSFLAANAILVIYFLLGNRNKIYFPLLVLSFILPELIAPILESSSSFISSAALKGRIEMYTDQAYVLTIQESFEQVAWFMKIGSDLVLYYLLFAVIVIQFLIRKKTVQTPDKNLLSFLMLFLSFVNFGMPIPSFGGRFMILFFLFGSLYVFRFFSKENSDRLAPLTIIGLFPMMLFAAITFRQGSETMNAWIFSPGFGIPWIMPELTVFEVLFQ